MKYAADKNSGLALDTDVLFHGHSSSKSTRCEGPKSVDKYALFEKFSQSGLCRLGLKPSQDIKFHEIWKEAEPFAVRYSNPMVVCIVFRINSFCDYCLKR